MFEASLKPLDEEICEERSNILIQNFESLPREVLAREVWLKAVPALTVSSVPKKDPLNEADAAQIVSFLSGAKKRRLCVAVEILR